MKINLILYKTFNSFLKFCSKFISRWSLCKAHEKGNIYANFYLFYAHQKFHMLTYLLYFWTSVWNNNSFSHSRVMVVIFTWNSYYVHGVALITLYTLSKVFVTMISYRRESVIAIYRLGNQVLGLLAHGHGDGKRYQMDMNLTTTCSNDPFKPHCGPSASTIAIVNSKSLSYSI